MNRSTRITTSPRPELTNAQPVLSAAGNDTFDEDFFRIVCRLFPPRFTVGAGVLLGSYDPE